MNTKPRSIDGRLWAYSDIEIVLARFAAGETPSDIAASFNSTGRSIGKIVSRCGIKSPRAERRAIEWTDEQIADITTRYKAGESSVTIAESYGRSTTDVRKLVNRLGVSCTTRGLRRYGARGLTFYTEEQLDVVVAGYTAGSTLEELAKEHSASVATVRKVIFRAGVETREAGPVRKYIPVNGCTGCTMCNEIKPLSEFQRNSTASTGYQSICKLCAGGLRRAARYGLDQTGFEALVAASGNRCEICGAGPADPSNMGNSTLSVDHCHETGKVCGLLCSKCNLGLGSLRNSPIFLRAAASYAERTRQPSTSQVVDAGSR